MGIPIVIEERIQHTFKFGSQKKASLGAAKFWIPYGGNQIMDMYLDVVDINIPLLLDLEKLDEQKLYVNNIKNVLVCVEPKWSHPITRKLGDLFYELTTDVSYTDNELKRVHRHFNHPHLEKIFNLLKKADDTETTPETLQPLHDVTENCDVCQRFASQPGRFRLSLPNNNIVFKRKILMDLKGLSSKSVLHFVCKDTLLSPAVFVSGEKPLYLWNACVQEWANPYVG